MIVTLENLTDAFRTWNERFLANPEEFWDSVDASDDCATGQAKYLLKLLEEAL